jgi:Flp pilus assembly protein TadD
MAMGKILAFQKNYSTALIYLDSALTLAPNNSLVNIEKGKIYAKVGKYYDAINLLRSALKFNGADPEILQNIAAVYQLIGSPKQGMPFHEAALNYTADQTAYLAITLSDAISGDPDLRLNQSNRIIAASYRRINADADDYVTFYHLARLRQIMGDTDAIEIMNKTIDVLQRESKKNPKDTHILMYLALTLTRLGRYSEAIAISERASAIDPLDEFVKYKIAQMYSLQMYAQKEKKLDEKKKDASLKYLHDALAINYRIDELINADFYNMYDHPEFRALIQEPLK